MKNTRILVPFLAIIALTALFFKMPESPDVWGIFKCKTCAINSPYIPIIGAAYFAVLLAISLLFPALPGPLIARGGLIWALLLTGSLTYIDYPRFCIACMVGHLCNISIWTIWLLYPSQQRLEKNFYSGERLFLTLFAPVAMVSLFGCMNLTFLVYNFKAKQNVSTSGIHEGEIAPALSSLGNVEGSNMAVNFVTPGCPYCLEQLPIINELAKGGHRIVNISATLDDQLWSMAPDAEWHEDKDGVLAKQYQVGGFPVLFVVGLDGKIAKVIAGVPKRLKENLLESLRNNQERP